MTSRTYTQFGKFSVAVLLPIMVLMVILLAITGFKDIVPALVLIFVILTFLVCLLIFYKLTIEIDNSYVGFKLGTGLVKKKYALKDIETCRPVKNSAFYGIGIRLIPEGWLYNVSGRFAVELTFKNKKSRIRIGTDKPEEVAEEINKLLNKPGLAPAYDKAYESSSRSGYYIFAVIILLGLIMPIVLIISGRKETNLDFTDSSFTINGIYGLTVDYSKIIRIDTIRSLPRIRVRTNGFALGNTLKGNFKLFDQTKVKLFVEAGRPPYINIKTDETELYLNFKDSSRTIELYRKISTALNPIP